MFFSTVIEFSPDDGAGVQFNPLQPGEQVHLPAQHPGDPPVKARQNQTSHTGIDIIQKYSDLKNL